MISPAIKLWFKEKWYLIVGAAVFGGLLLWFAFRKKDIQKETIDKAAVVLQKRLADVRIQAALEIGKAQGREAEIKQEVTYITNMPVATTEDQKKQLQALSDLVNRTRRRS
jgi:LPXTG-motif cell wall-anchored protein